MELDVGADAEIQSELVALRQSHFFAELRRATVPSSAVPSARLAADVGRGAAGAPLASQRGALRPPWLMAPSIPNGATALSVDIEDVDMATSRASPTPSSKPSTASSSSSSSARPAAPATRRRIPKL